MINQISKGVSIRSFLNLKLYSKGCLRQKTGNGMRILAFKRNFSVLRVRKPFLFRCVLTIYVSRAKKECGQAVCKCRDRSIPAFIAISLYKSYPSNETLVVVLTNISHFDVLPCLKGDNSNSRLNVNLIIFLYINFRQDFVQKVENGFFFRTKYWKKIF